MSLLEQDKPYKSIDLNVVEAFALKFALRDRERHLVAGLDVPGCSPEFIEESSAQLLAVRKLLKLL